MKWKPNGAIGSVDAFKDQQILVPLELVVISGENDIAIHIFSKEDDNADFKIKLTRLNALGLWGLIGAALK